MNEFLQVMNKKDQLTIIEQNHLGHFAFLPRNLGFDVTEIHGVTVINCALQSSMFNIAYGAPKDLAIGDAIHEIKQAFGGEPFAWWIPPSGYNPEVTKILLENGLIMETVEHAMICDVTDGNFPEQKTDLIIKNVKSKQLLEDFISVLEPYDPAVRGFYEKMSNELLQSEEKLVVGYIKGKPVTIGIVFIRGNSAGIFSLIANEEARGKGYGRDMMVFLMKIAKENNCQHITLSASSDSGYRIYERLGFHKVGEFECFEYKGKDAQR